MSNSEIIEGEEFQSESEAMGIIREQASQNLEEGESNKTYSGLQYQNTNTKSHLVHNAMQVDESQISYNSIAGQSIIKIPSMRQATSLLVTPPELQPAQAAEKLPLAGKAVHSRNTKSRSPMDNPSNPHCYNKATDSDANTSSFTNPKPKPRQRMDRTRSYNI